MTFVTTAHEIQAACCAGLVLVGELEHMPQYIGTAEQWNHYQLLIG